MKQAQVPMNRWTNEWLKETRYTHASFGHKEIEILSFSRTRMDLESTMLSKVSQTQKDKHCIFFLICRISKIWQESRRVTITGQEEGNKKEGIIIVGNEGMNMSKIYYTHWNPLQIWNFGGGWGWRVKQEWNHQCMLYACANLPRWNLLIFTTNKMWNKQYGKIKLDIFEIVQDSVCYFIELIDVYLEAYFVAP